MMPTEPAVAELIWSIHQPWKATLSDCLSRWQALDPRFRAQSWLILHGQAGARRTLNAAHIAELAARRADHPN